MKRPFLDQAITTAANILLAATITAGCGAGGSAPEHSKESEIADIAAPLTGPDALAVGELHACTILNPSGQVKCWGGNASGQLGLGDTNNRGDNAGEMGASLPAVSLGWAGTPQRIAAGGSHTCAIAPDSRVKCWGSNTYGQLGLGDTTHRGDNAGEMGTSLPYVDLGGRTAKSLALGRYHTCAILDTNAVRCWGRNDYGQLGLGDITSRGDNAGEMGASLPDVSLGTNRTAKFLAAGFLHTCAILDNDTVKCWGANYSGQLGLNDMANRGDAAGEMGNALPTVTLAGPTPPTGLFLGMGHTCAWFTSPPLTTDAGKNAVKVACWGNNLMGQLGHGDTVARGCNPGDMASLPLTTVYTASSYATVVGGTAGADHTCVSISYTLVPPAVAPPQVKCWGGNTYGQLGQGSTTAWGDNVGEGVAGLPFIPSGSSTVAIGASIFGTCSLYGSAGTGWVRCFGRGNTGLPGLGNTSNIGDGPGEMPPATISF